MKEWGAILIQSEASDPSIQSIARTPMHAVDHCINEHINELPTARAPLEPETLVMEVESVYQTIAGKYDIHCTNHAIIDMSRDGDTTDGATNHYTT